jgi:hypothetical protein
VNGKAMNGKLVLVVAEGCEEADSSLLLKPTRLDEWGLPCKCSMGFLLSDYFRLAGCCLLVNGLRFDVSSGVVLTR